MATKSSTSIMMDKNKLWKMESLMENLRSKPSRSFQELTKVTRLNLLEKRYNIDAVEKQILQTAVDSLQNNIQIKSKANLIERLETVSRQLGLKFTENSSSLFISSDMFYLEILLDSQSGIVNDVKVHHECSNDSESEPYIKAILRKGDFIDFTQQLEGFQSIYQLNAESKIKSKALIALQALERDLLNMYTIEKHSDAIPETVVLTSAVGLLTKRRGGHPMKLTFFVSPMELLNFEHKKIDSLTDALYAADLAKKNIGNSVTINLEAAAPSNKLQNIPLLMHDKSYGSFVYNPIGPHNSTMLPACFVLRLNKAMAVTTQIVEEIIKITGLNIFGGDSLPVLNSGVKIENGTASVKEPGSLVNLIISNDSQGTHLNGTKGLFVSLTDQSHCYFMTDNPEMTGSLIKSIQFTEPSHVTKIINLLRQQALFNALIGSCVRQNGKQDLESCYMFEINIVSLQHIQIFVEHPLRESIVTVELDLSDVKEINCKIYGGEQQFDSKLENYILRVMQKSYSIPMMLRGLIKYWDNENQEHQRLQKRLYSSNNGMDGKNDDKNIGKDDGHNNNDDIYNGNGQDNSVTGASFDICGINKNEIFFKTNEQKMENDSANSFERSNKMAGSIMNFDIDDETNLISEELMNENSNSPASSSSSMAAVSAAQAKKNLLFHTKSATPISMQQKSNDPFEFNDPSPPMQSPRIPTPRASPSASAANANDKKWMDMEIIPLKNQLPSPKIPADVVPHLMGQPTSSPSSLTIAAVGSGKSEQKKKKRKREDGEMSSPSMSKKKSSESLSGSPLKKVSVSPSQIMGKPAVSFKPMKSPSSEKKKIEDFGGPSTAVGNSIDTMDDLSFLNFAGVGGGDSQQQQQTVPSPLPSPQNLQKNSQANRSKNSLSAVIDKLKSEMGDDKKSSSEYQIKSSGNSDGIKITLNKTKSSKSGSSSSAAKHTGLKPGVNSGPASKKSSSGKSSSSQKLLYQKSSSSGSLNQGSSPGIPSPKSSSQPGKTSNDMLKNMLNFASTSPRMDMGMSMKAFDKKFQIPKLSARSKCDEKSQSMDVPDITGQQMNFMHHPRSAPTTPIHQSLTPSPTMMDFSASTSSSMGQKYFQQQQQQNKFVDHQQHQRQKSKKLFKSVSSEQLMGYGDDTTKNFQQERQMDAGNFQTFLRNQTKTGDGTFHHQTGMSLDPNMMMHHHQQQPSVSGQQMSMSVDDDLIEEALNLNFIGNEI